MRSWVGLHGGRFEAPRNPGAAVEYCEAIVVVLCADSCNLDRHVLNVLSGYAIVAMGDSEILKYQQAKASKHLYFKNQLAANL